MPRIGLVLCLLATLIYPTLTESQYEPTSSWPKDCPISDIEKEINDLLINLDPASLDALDLRKAQKMSLGNQDGDLPDFWAHYRLGIDLIKEDRSLNSSPKVKTVIGLLDSGVDMDLMKKLKLPIENIGDKMKPDSFGHGSHTFGTTAGRCPYGLGEGRNFETKFCTFEPTELVIKEQQYYTKIIKELDKLAKVPDVRAVGASLRFGLDEGHPYQIKPIFAKKNVLLINSTGNDSSDLENLNCKGICELDNILFVGSVSPYGTLSEFSNYGKNMFLVGPGEAIYSILPSNAKTQDKTMDYNDGSCEMTLVRNEGTSMATPHVTGTVGILYSIYPELKAADVIKILELTAIDLGPKGRDKFYGHGLVNPFAAAKMAQLMKDKKSAPEAQKILMAEADTYYKQGQAQLLSALKAFKQKPGKAGFDRDDRENQKQVLIASKNLRRAYHLNPTLENKRLLFLLERALGSKTMAFALGTELYSETNKFCYAESVINSPMSRFKLARFQLEKLIVEEERTGKTPPIDAYFYYMDQIPDSHLTAALKTKEDLRKVFDQLFLKGNDVVEANKKAKIKQVLLSYLERRTPVEGEELLLKEYAQKILSSKEISDDSVLYPLIKYKKEALGITEDQLVSMLEAEDGMSFRAFGALRALRGEPRASELLFLAHTKKAERFLKRFKAGEKLSDKDVKEIHTFFENGTSMGVAYDKTILENYKKVFRDLLSNSYSLSSKEEKNKWATTPSLQMELYLMNNIIPKEDLTLVSKTTKSWALGDGEAKHEEKVQALKTLKYLYDLPKDQELYLKEFSTIATKMTRNKLHAQLSMLLEDLTRDNIQLTLDGKIDRKNMLGTLFYLSEVGALHQKSKEGTELNDKLSTMVSYGFSRMDWNHPKAKALLTDVVLKRGDEKISVEDADKMDGLLLPFMSADTERFPDQYWDIALNLCTLPALTDPKDKSNKNAFLVSISCQKLLRMSAANTKLIALINKTTSGFEYWSTEQAKTLLSHLLLIDYEATMKSVEKAKEKPTPEEMVRIKLAAFRIASQEPSVIPAEVQKMATSLKKDLKIIKEKNTEPEYYYTLFYLTTQAHKDKKKSDVKECNESWIEFFTDTKTDAIADAAFVNIKNTWGPDSRRRLQDLIDKKKLSPEKEIKVKGLLAQ